MDTCIGSIQFTSLLPLNQVTCPLLSVPGRLTGREGIAWEKE